MNTMVMIIYTNITYRKNYKYSPLNNSNFNIVPVNIIILIFDKYGFTYI